MVIGPYGSCTVETDSSINNVVIRNESDISYVGGLGVEDKG